jgi:hypothetical protein
MLQLAASRAAALPALEHCSNIASANRPMIHFSRFALDFTEIFS